MYSTSKTTKTQAQKLRAYSHSIITAIVTCPTWGIVHYTLRKTYHTEARAMALEFGSALHEVFAALRLLQLDVTQHLPKHTAFHANRMFDKIRWVECYAHAPETDLRDRAVQLGFNILHSGPYYDDPSDRIRTITAAEECILKYVDETIDTWDNWHVWVEDKANPEKTVGIEYSFDMVLTRDSDKKQIRYIGTVDTVLVALKKAEALYLGENKTGARLSDSWRNAFDTSHQVTGYLVGLSTVLNRELTLAKVFGVKTKQTGHIEDFASFEPLERDDSAFQHFCNWVFHGAELAEQFKGDIEMAPRYTHSCDRYFRACSMLPFCTDTPEGRQQQLKEMVETELSPSEQAVIDSWRNTP